jgi:hypothetical protein
MSWSKICRRDEETMIRNRIDDSRLAKTAKIGKPKSLKLPKR